MAITDRLTNIWDDFMAWQKKGTTSWHDLTGRRIFLMAFMIMFMGVFVSTCAEAQVPSDEMHISWTNPDQRTDGTALDSVASNKIYFGQDAGNLSGVIRVTGPFAPGSEGSFVFDSLSEGLWFTAVTALDSVGQESSFSNVVSKTILVPTVPCPWNPSIPAGDPACLECPWVPGIGDDDPLCVAPLPAPPNAPIMHAGQIVSATPPPELSVRQTDMMTLDGTVEGLIEETNIDFLDLPQWRWQVRFKPAIISGGGQRLVNRRENADGFAGIWLWTSDLHAQHKVNGNESLLRSNQSASLQAGIWYTATLSCGPSGLALILDDRLMVHDINWTSCGSAPNVSSLLFGAALDNSGNLTRRYTGDEEFAIFNSEAEYDPCSVNPAGTINADPMPDNPSCP
jgi:hypothetical protein